MIKFTTKKKNVKPQIEDFGNEITSIMNNEP